MDGGVAPLIGEPDPSSHGAPHLSTTDLRDELALHHPSAFAWAVRCSLGDRAEAEDVLHHAYCKVLEGKARFDGRSAFRTWLFGVIRVTARERRRWEWLGATRLERWWRESPRANGADAGGEGDDRVAALVAALQRLSPRQQEVLHLVFYQGLTIQEASGVMGMPVGTARTHYERGKSRLRGLLSRPEGARG